MPPGIYPRPPMELNAVCDRCGKTFHIKPSKLARGRGRYCSRRCWKPYENRPADEWFPEMLAWQGTCLVWTGARDHGEYGQLPHLVNGIHKAHRYAYFRAHGVDPSELRVCHRCDNPPCCLPEHLFLGTDADNLADMRAKGRAAPPAAAGRPGASNPLAKLTTPQAADVRRRYAAAIGVKRARRGSNGTITALAREFGVTPGVIWRIVQGVSYPPMSD